MVAARDNGGAMSVSGTNLPDYQVLLSRLKSSGQWDRVWDYAGEWLSSDPENLRAHLAAGQAAIQLKRFTEARPHIDRVLEGEPDNGFAHRLLSIVQFHAGENAAADESIRKAISLAPNDPYHWYHLGWMCYRQGARPAARSCVEKARELAPNNSDIINLLALCEPESPDTAARKFQQYRQALELDPENSDVHNNLGVHYLNIENDPKKAEVCFRRSLSLNPSSALARKNLFITLKKRDPVFRVLHAPRDFLARGMALVGKSRRRNLIMFLLVLPIWILSARFVIGGLALWFLFVWPLVKVYERLTLGDIKADAGELGARKGGLFGYHRWSLKVRLGIFAAFLFAFWGGTAYGYWRWPAKGEIALGFSIGTVLIVLLVSSARSSMRKSREEAHGKKRAKLAQSLLSTKKAKKTWWSLFRRKTASHE